MNLGQWLQPSLITAVVAVIALVVANPLSPPRRAERRLTRILTNLDKLPDEPEFETTRAAHIAEAVDAARDAATGYQVPTPWRHYVWCVGASAIAVAFVWGWWDADANDMGLRHEVTAQLMKLLLLGIILLPTVGWWESTVIGTRRKRSAARAQLEAADNS